MAVVEITAVEKIVSKMESIVDRLCRQINQILCLRIMQENQVAWSAGSENDIGQT